MTAPYPEPMGTDGSPRPLVVTKDRLTRALSCEAHPADTEFGKRVPTMAMACGAIVDVLFRQLVTVGSIGDPMGDGLAALSVDDRQAETGLVDRAIATARAGRDCGRRSSARPTASSGGGRRWSRHGCPARRRPYGSAWPAVPSSCRPGWTWLSGGPPSERSSVAIVEIKSGTRRIEHRADLHFYALIEALRSPAPPVRGGHLLHAGPANWTSIR